jgi:pimeloyl-ACP methyl ester carboxylesterase
MKNGNAQIKEDVGFVFIQGAGLQSWIWERVVSEMKHPVLLIDFPEGENGSRKGLAMRDYNDHIKQQVEVWDIEKYIVVGHSWGGLPALVLSSDLPGRVVGFIAIGATIPKSGGSFLSTFPPAKRLLMHALLRIFGTRPTASAIRKGLCNDLSYDQASEVVDAFVPESIHIYTDRIRAMLPADLPKLYIKLTRDQEMQSSHQDRMIANLNPQSIEQM